MSSRQLHKQGSSDSNFLRTDTSLRSPTFKAKQTDLHHVSGAGPPSPSTSDVVLELGLSPPYHHSFLASLLALDEALSHKAYHVGAKYVPRSVLVLLEHSGNGLIWIPFALLFIFIPVDKAMRVFCANLWLGFLVDLVLVGLLKAVIQRQRPAYNNPNDYHVVNKIDHYSFPSGHASRCTFIALIACIYGAMLDTWGWLVSILVLLWGLATSASRALMGRHFVFDVGAGCVVGFMTVAIVSLGTFQSSSMLVN